MLTFSAEKAEKDKPSGVSLNETVLAREPSSLCYQRWPDELGRP